MDNKEFIKLFNFVEYISSKYKKMYGKNLYKEYGGSPDWIELTTYLLKNVRREHTFERSKKRVLNSLRNWRRVKEYDEYYEPESILRRNDCGELVPVEISDNHRIHTAYGKDISSECPVCKNRFIKNGDRQVYCSRKCRNINYYNNISK